MNGELRWRLRRGRQTVASVLLAMGWMGGISWLLSVIVATSLLYYWMRSLGVSWMWMGQITLLFAVIGTLVKAYQTGGTEIEIVIRPELLTVHQRYASIEDHMQSTVRSISRERIRSVRVGLASLNIRVVRGGTERFEQFSRIERRWVAGVIRRVMDLPINRN